MGKKYLSGDIIITSPAILYMVIYKSEVPGGPIFVGEVWDGKYPEGTVPCIRLRYNREPDRRFMSVKTTKDTIGQFKVWFLKEEDVQLYRRIMPEKTPMMIDPNNIVRDLSNAIFKFNSEKYPLIANSIVISEDGFKELCEYYSTCGNGYPLQKPHDVSDIKFRELTVYRSQDMKKEKFIIMSDGK